MEELRNALSAAIGAAEKACLSTSVEEERQRLMLIKIELIDLNEQLKKGE